MYAVITEWCHKKLSPQFLLPFYNAEPADVKAKIFWAQVTKVLLDHKLFRKLEMLGARLTKSLHWGIFFVVKFDISPFSKDDLWKVGKPTSPLSTAPKVRHAVLPKSGRSSLHAVGSVCFCLLEYCKQAGIHRQCFLFSAKHKVLHWRCADAVPVSLACKCTRRVFSTGA